MSNVATAITALATLAEFALNNKDGIRTGTSPAGNRAAIDAAWNHLATARQRPGLDPMTNARVNALLQANTAHFAASRATTQAQVDALTSMGNALMRIHDQLSGVSWYSLPGTVRNVRSETLRTNESAENRELLLKIVDLLTTLTAQTAQPKAPR